MTTIILISVIFICFLVPFGIIQDQKKDFRKYGRKCESYTQFCERVYSSYIK